MKTNTKENKNIENVEIDEVVGEDIPRKLNDGSLNENEETQNNIIDFVKDIFDIKLLRGHYTKVGHPIFAIQMKCKKFNDVDKLVFTYTEFFNNKDSKKIIDKINYIYPLGDVEIKLMKDYIKQLLDRDIYESVNTLDNFIEGVYSDIDTYKELIVDFILDNQSKFTSRAESNYDDKIHVGLWLDREQDVKKYGENAVAILPQIVNEKIILKQDGKRVDTKTRGNIIEKLIEAGIFHDEGRKGSIQIRPSHLYTNAPRFYVINLPKNSYIEEGDRNE